MKNKTLSDIRQEYKGLYFKTISNKKRFYSLLSTLKRIFKIGLFVAETYFHFILLPNLWLSRDFSEDKQKVYLSRQGNWLHKKFLTMGAVFIKAR
ncbi:MAG: hypothetical protein MK289_01135 [Trichodesmium sp. ALOHA_ZT_67]|nr:hypothetical protein [Trichodesmium sp. ALOHA_ZT_67]